MVLAKDYNENHFERLLTKSSHKIKSSTQFAFNCVHNGNKDDTAAILFTTATEIIFSF